MAIQQIQPQTNFPISRLLPDLGDNVTYYVQAVVRNASTNATIATVNLASVGSRIWASLWYTPQDSSGRGLYITITTVAYTDSAYTAPSLNYSPESSTYILYDQFHQLQGLATQLSALLGGEMIDYKKIRKIMKEVVATIELEEIEQIDYTPELKALGNDLKQAIGAIEMPDMPEYEQTDLSPLKEHISGVEARIHNRFDKLPEPEKLDLSPVLDRFDKYNFEDKLKKVDDASELLNEMSDRLSKTMPEMGKYFDEIISNLKDFLYTISKNEPKKPKKSDEENEITAPVISRSGEPRTV